MDICATMPPKRSDPLAGLAFGQGGHGLFSPMRPMGEQSGVFAPTPATAAANAFDRCPFRGEPKVYGALFLAIILINIALYGWQLAALAPLLPFIIDADGTSNNAMYFLPTDRHSSIFTGRSASLAFLQPKMVAIP